MSRFFSIAAACVLLGGAAQADTHLYVQLQGGPSFAHDSDVSDRRGPVNGQIRYEHGELNVFEDMGFNGSGAVGVHFARGEKHSFRVEVLGGYNRSEIKKVRTDDGNTVARGGHLSVGSVLANGYYEHDFGNLAWFKAFVGGGVGAGFVDFGGPRGSSTVFIDDDSTEFAWNATAGVVLPLGDHVDLTGAYRFLSTTDPELETTVVDPATGAVMRRGKVDAEVGIHDLQLGIRFTF